MWKPAVAKRRLAYLFYSNYTIAHSTRVAGAQSASYSRYTHCRRSYGFVDLS
ncbi:hypothetical protein GQ600_1561 [Phytophthora cactorum]|nr:hypothetical protein GQ600_1561 [Phytophthora cactorum]